MKAVKMAKEEKPEKKRKGLLPPLKGVSQPESVIDRATRTPHETEKNTDKPDKPKKS